MSQLDLEFFEKVIFQQCLKKESTFLASCVQYLDKTLFRNKDIGVIIDVIKGFYLEHDIIPNHTELKARINTAQLKSSLKEAIDSIRNLDKEYLEEELIKNTEYFLKHRSFENMIEKCLDDKVSKNEMDMDEAHKENDRIQAISLIDNLGLDYFGENERVVEMLLEKESFISTGYPSLDKALGGGMFKEGKCIYGIGGETNVGKSLMVGNIGANVLKNKYDVLIITLEMSEKRYAKRLSSMLSEIKLNDLSSKIDDYREYVVKFNGETGSRLFIKEFATKSISAKNIQAFLKRLERKKGFKPALIILDYHTLLKPSVVQASKHVELQYITQEVRGLSYVAGCPILTPAQLNRGSHKAASPGLDNVSGSWDMLSDFDGFVVLSQTDDDREQNIIRFGGKKVRDGAKGHESHLKIDYDTLRFYEESDEESHVAQEEQNISETIDFKELYG